MSHCEQAGVHLPGTGHSQTDCPTTCAETWPITPEIAGRTDIPEHRKKWGWGADPNVLKASRKPSKVGILCTSCDDRFLPGLEAIA